MALPIARYGTVGLASQSVPCVTPASAQKPSALKTKKSVSNSVSCDFLHAKSKTRMACWNVRSLGALSAQSAPLRGVISTMKEKNIDLLALSESRWPGSGSCSVSSYNILYSGTPSTHVHGVAIILSPRAKLSWEAAGSVFHPISERILYIRLKSHLSFVSVIAVYAPTNPVSSTADSSTPSDNFYHLLQSTLSLVPKNDLLVILGDLNARVGANTTSWHSVIGPHTLGECNESGVKLLDFCANNQLLITNTWFQHKSIHQATWFRNGDRSRTGHMIDLVLVNTRFRSSVLDTRVYRNTYHESDHELVVSTFQFKIKSKRHQLRPSHCIVSGLSSTTKASFQSAFSAPFNHLFQGDVDTSWEAFRAAVCAASETLPMAPPKHEAEWVTDELRNLSKKKRNAWLHLHDANSTTNLVDRKAGYLRLKKLTKVAADKARNAWWSARAVEAERRAWVAEQTGCGGFLIKELRLLKCHFNKPRSTILYAKDGAPLSNDTDKINRWAEHFNEVVNCNLHVINLPTSESLPVIHSHALDDTMSDVDMCGCLSEDEIRTAISQMKKGKAPGSDEISTELLMLGSEECVRWLKIVFDSIWQHEAIPNDWKNQIIVPLHKGDIALLSIPSKVFAKAILNRLKPRADSLLRENQCGFRKGRGCADQLFTLRILMEKAREFRQPLYVCFIDLRKAYNSVNRESLWILLQDCYNLPPKLLSILRALYSDSKAIVRSYGLTSEEFSVTCGVRQGCVLAPTLFNLFFDVAIHLALRDHEGKGVKFTYLYNTQLVGNRKVLREESIVSDLEYADDMAIMADNWEDLSAMVRLLSHHCSSLGLSISCKKTKTLAVLPTGSHQLPQPILLPTSDDPIEVVSHFQYLGSVVQDDCNCDTEVDTRICKASAAFQSLSRILWFQRRIKTATKLRILNSVILPTLLYGLECTVLLEPQIRRLESFLIRCLRIILGISTRDMKRNTTIRKLAKQQRLSSILSQRRLRFLGHLSRMGDQRLPKQLLVSALVGGKRAPGGQKLRWNDLVTRDLRACGLLDSWRELAQDRDEWRRKVKEVFEGVNKNAESDEKACKDMKKRRREDRLAATTSTLRCDHPGCSFIATTNAGITNHKRQKHQQLVEASCRYCHQTFNVQGL